MDPSRVVRALYRGPREPAGGVANPYRDESPDLDLPGAAKQRRRNLEAYLERVGRPRLVLLGEALGFRGGRFSGIAFTSERQLAGPGERRLPWATSPPFLPTSRNPALWLEPSGSVVWGALGGEPAGVLLWNAFPWHPCGSARAAVEPHARAQPASSAACPSWSGSWRRSGTRGCSRSGARPRRRWPPSASRPRRLRHPAHGGAEVFRQQLRACRPAC